MKNKKILKIILTLAVLGSTTTVNAYAKDVSIPTRMQPGTVIQYDEEENMKVIDSGIESNKAISKNNNIKIDLPKPEAGMTVSYDGTGLPTKITDKDNNIINFNVKTDNESLTEDSDENLVERYSPDEPSVNWKHTGYITWYTDRVGQRDHVLQNYDCATKIGHEEPACGTTIVARRNGAQNKVYLTKWDIGTLPNAILDIRPYAFQHAFGYDLDVGHFYGKYGW